MPDLKTEIAQRAHALPEEDRARLAEELLASLEGPVDPVIDAPWDAEIRKRIAEVEAGTASLVPADEVFARARRALA
jgi:putative addiction module component (TIGR02574 family)